MTKKRRKTGKRQQEDNQLEEIEDSNSKNEIKFKPRLRHWKYAQGNIINEISYI